ncbi:MAG TPA: GDSL-type esterase/lipase family protein [Mycobacteriales bacterium]
MPPVRLAVLGDSIAYGTGAAARSDTIGARLHAALLATGRDAVVDVVAVPGARSAGLAAQVRRALRRPPDVAVVVIGANDLAHLADPTACARALGDAVAALTAAGARVVVATAPDLSVVPGVPAAFRGAVREASAAYAALQAAAVTAAGGAVASLGSLLAPAFAGDVSLFAADRYHPSSAGHALIADALAPYVLAAAA